MKATEFIKKLNKLICLYGDRDIKLFRSHDGLNNAGVFKSEEYAFGSFTIEDMEECFFVDESE